MSIFSVFTLLGGLAFFIYGMNQMSRSLEIIAGEKMEAVINKLTSRRFLGLLGRHYHGLQYRDDRDGLDHESDRRFQRKHLCADAQAGIVCAVAGVYRHRPDHAGQASQEEGNISRSPSWRRAGGDSARTHISGRSSPATIRFFRSCSGNTGNGIGWPVPPNKPYK